jgi:exopolysaccharide biosynthesis protein
MKNIFNRPKYGISLNHHRLSFAFFLVLFLYTPILQAASTTSGDYLLLSPGLQYREVITKAKQIVHVMEVDPNRIKITIAHAKGQAKGRETVKGMAKANGAIAAVNGGFFHTDGSPSGILKINNRWYGESKNNRATIGWSNGGKTVLIDKIKTKKRGKKSKSQSQVDVSPFYHPGNKKIWQQFDNMVSGIPLLIFKDKITSYHYGEKFGKKFAKNQHARTAVGLLKNGHWIFLVVEQNGQNESPGMTIPELATFMQKEGAEYAINLDGGGSSTLYINDKVINNPQGDIDEDLGIRIERPVGDSILMFKR